MKKYFTRLYLAFLFCKKYNRFNVNLINEVAKGVKDVHTTHPRYITLNVGYSCNYKNIFFNKEA